MSAKYYRPYLSAVEVSSLISLLTPRKDTLSIGVLLKLQKLGVSEARNSLSLQDELGITSSPEFPTSSTPVNPRVQELQDKLLNDTITAEEEAELMSLAGFSL